MNDHFPVDDSGFATPEEAEAYDRWFRAKVEMSLADPRPGIPHDQVMAEMDAIIADAIRCRVRASATHSGTTSTPLAPLVSEFATAEEAEAYDRWFRARVEASLADPRPSIPHDEAMASIRAKLGAELRRLSKAT